MRQVFCYHYLRVTLFNLWNNPVNSRFDPLLMDDEIKTQNSSWGHPSNRKTDISNWNLLFLCPFHNIIATIIQKKCSGDSDSGNFQKIIWGEAVNEVDYMILEICFSVIAMKLCTYSKIVVIDCEGWNAYEDT